MARSHAHRCYKQEKAVLDMADWTKQGKNEFGVEKPRCWRG